jgi:hypothetical protein
MGLFDNGIEPDDPCPHRTDTACDHCRQVRTLRDALFSVANGIRAAVPIDDEEARLNVLRHAYRRAISAARADPEPGAWR